MAGIQVRQAQTPDLPAIAHIIAGQNRKPETACVHSYTGDTSNEILREIMGLHASAEICFVMGVQDGAIDGLFGAEFDAQLGRAWLRGPFILYDRWEPLAAMLYQELRHILPASIRRLDSFLNVANQKGHRFFLRLGFQERGRGHTYVASPRPQPLPVADPLQETQHAAFARLHDEIFPDTYYSGQDILDQIDGEHRVFVRTNGDELLGYVYATIEDSARGGEIEFLGVRAGARRQGFGRCLLSTALHWAFETRQLPQVVLTVDDKLANARSLYEKAGFRHKNSGVNMRQEW